MTKRIVSGVFLLIALGALGLILAGALTSGEQLIVRFLTAIIVAALALYVISDLRLQANDNAVAAGNRTTVSSPRVTSGGQPPPNSTAAFMATVTGKRSSSTATMDERTAADEATVTRRSREPTIELASRVRTDAKPEADVKVTDPSDAEGEWSTTFRAYEDGADREDMPGAEDEVSPYSDEVSPYSSEISAASEWPFNGESTVAEGEYTIARSGNVKTDDDLEGLVAIFARKTEQEQSQRAAVTADEARSDTAGDVHPDGAEPLPTTPFGRTPVGPPPAGEDGAVDPLIDNDPTVGETTVTEPTRIGLRRETVTTTAGPDPASSPVNWVDDGSSGPDRGPDQGGSDLLGTPDEAEPDQDTTDDRATAPDAEADADADREVGDFLRPGLALAGAVVESATNPAPAGDDAWQIEPEEALPGEPDDGARSAAAAATSVSDSLEAASYAQESIAPIIDLRLTPPATTPNDDVEQAIRSGEVEVISSLIEQGVLSADGPISDRDVRTMVYVAFTSSELRKILLAGGTIDGDNSDLELGDVEVFPEALRNQPRALGAGPRANPDIDVRDDYHGPDSQAL